MNKITKNNKLSFYNDQGVIVVTAKQYDTGRKFAFEIIDEYSSFDIGDCIADLRISKSDNTQFQSSSCCYIEDNKIIVDTSLGNGAQILTSAGDNKCELKLYNSDNIILTTWPFIIRVEATIHDGKYIQSENSYDILDTIQINENIRILDELQRVEDEKTRAENEKLRIENEEQRISAESHRAENEQLRLDEMDSLVSQNKLYTEETATMLSSVQQNVETTNNNITEVQGLIQEVNEIIDAGIQGAKGDTGDKGDTGIRGSRWTTGTAITGTSSLEKIFANSGIADALVNDYYVNTDTGNIYVCTIGGNASAAKWLYQGNLKKHNVTIKSDELGSNWTSLNLKCPCDCDYFDVSCMFLLKNKVYAIHDNTLYEIPYSSENGEFLEKTTIGKTITCCIKHPSDDYVVFKTTSSELYKWDGEESSLIASLENNYDSIAINQNGRMVGYYYNDGCIVLQYSDNYVTWTDCTISFDRECNINFIIGGEVGFLAVDDGGTQYYSENGIAWTQTSPSWSLTLLSSINQGLYDNDSKIYILADDEGFYVLNETNEPYYYTCEYTPRVITIHKGIYAIGCTGGQYLISYDAKDWKLIQTNSEENITDMILTEAGLVACLRNEGIKYIEFQSQEYNIDNIITSLSNNLSILQQRQEEQNSLTLKDKLGNWENTDITAANDEVDVINSIAYGNGIYVAVSIDGTIYMSSDNKITWTIVNDDANTCFYHIIYVNNMFIAVGANGYIYWSYDGINWESKQVNTSSCFIKIKYEHEYYILFTDSTTWYSKDLVSFHYFSSYYFEDIIYHNGIYIGVTITGFIYHMSNFNEFIEKCTGSQISKIVYGNGLFLGVSNDEYINYSIDGETWNKILIENHTFTDISYYNGTFICIGYDATPQSLILSSADGITWETIYTDTNRQFKSIICNQQGCDILQATTNKIFSAKFLDITKSIKDVVYDMYTTKTKTKIPYMITYISDWKESTQYEGYGYVCEKTITDYYDLYPEYFLRPLTGIVPSSEEEEAFACISAMILDVNEMKLKFYASTKPSTYIKVLIKGVE